MPDLATNVVGDYTHPLAKGQQHIAELLTAAGLAPSAHDVEEEA